MHFWLPNDILLKADKMSMANSLELRVPILDKEVFALASTIPTEYKISHDTTKYILRKAASDRKLCRRHRELHAGRSQRIVPVSGLERLPGQTAAAAAADFPK